VHLLPVLVLVLFEDLATALRLGQVAAVACFRGVLDFLELSVVGALAHGIVVPEGEYSAVESLEADEMQ
jgi:hypothetical protein